MDFLLLVQFFYFICIFIFYCKSLNNLLYLIIKIIQAKNINNHIDKNIKIYSFDNKNNNIRKRNNTKTKIKNESSLKTLKKESSNKILISKKDIKQKNYKNEKIIKRNEEILTQKSKKNIKIF